jgi:catechol 2,3-dioxygenase-like lactoylglutathione lyase family enzyme
MPEPAPTGPAVPILRIFDRAKAREFYVDFLGFTVDWEHGGDGSPLYTQVSRGGTVLHLSEHHGDASPGGAALIGTSDVAALQRELREQHYAYARPGVRDEEWGRVLVVIDPFHNRLVFHQPRPSDGAD